MSTRHTNTSASGTIVRSFTKSIALVAAILGLPAGIVSPAAAQSTTYWYPQNNTNNAQTGQPGQTNRPPGTDGQPWHTSPSTGSAFDLEKGKSLFIGIPNTQKAGKKYATFTIEGTGITFSSGKPVFKLKKHPGYGYYYDNNGTPEDTSDDTSTGQQQGKKDWYAKSGTQKWIGSVSFAGKDGCPAWEWIALENQISGAGGGAMSFNLKISAESKCESVSRSGSSISGDATFGCDEPEDVAMITEILDFPETAPIDMGMPPMFIAPPESGTWTSEFVFTDPDGNPRPGGGVRWFSDGPGLLPGQSYFFSYAMLGDADLHHTEYAFDAMTGDYQFFVRDLSPSITEWRTMRHSTSGSLGMRVDPVAMGDKTRGPDGLADPVASLVPTAETRLGGIQRIEIDFDQPVFLVDPGAVGVSGTLGPFAPAGAFMENGDTTLVLEFPEGALPDDSAYLIDVAGAIADLSGGTNAMVLALTGDVNGDGRVNEADELVIDVHLGEPGDGDNAHLDLDLDGLITPSDKTIVQENDGDSVLCPGAFPTVPWYEDFDDFDPGTGLHGGCGWKGWDDDPAFDAPVTDEQARGGSQSVKIDGDADLVNEIERDDSLEIPWHSFSGWQYIPSNFESGGGDTLDGSYFILLNTYQTSGPYHWSVQMQFDSNDGMLKVFHGDGTNTIDVPYDTDRWVKIQTIVDEEDDWTRVYYDDELIAEYSWTGGVLGDGGGALDIAAVDLFAQGSTSVYYDDLRLEPIAGCGSALDGDEDGDGLSLLDEFLGGTDSCAPDTDEDGVLDGTDNCPLAHNPAQADGDGDGVGDACDPEVDCPGDVDGDGNIGFSDLLAVLSQWGDCPGCPEDIDGDGGVGFGDLLEVLSTWGDCP